jgi:hypothetical protein
MPTHAMKPHELGTKWAVRPLFVVEYGSDQRWSSMRKRKCNPKRKIDDSIVATTLQSLSTRVLYSGNPAHKKNPGDFGLTPPAQPRLNKILCDATGIQRQSAMKLLRKGVKLGLVSLQHRGDFPQNIWAVSDNGFALEAALENIESGTYHGYPMEAIDPLAVEVKRRWEEGASNE